MFVFDLKLLVLVLGAAASAYCVPGNNTDNFANLHLVVVALKLPAKLFQLFLQTNRLA